MKPGSKQWKNFMAKLYGIGAAVVIVGALFKIQHWPLAGFFLITGLSTEAIIFMFSAFEPPHEEYDWSLVYPELATGEHAEGDDFKKEDQRRSNRS
jgi:gliding motility-associated protein GldL